MFKTLEIFAMANGLATHAGARQSTIATNIANADTPGYRARDIPEFAAVFEIGSADNTMKTTRGKHWDSVRETEPGFREAIIDGPTSPNGNSVSLETEMMKASQVRLQHDMALSVFSTSLNILRTSLGRGG